MKPTTYYIGYMEDGKFRVLATSRDEVAAYFIFRAYNQFNREHAAMAYDYRIFPKDRLPEHWNYVRSSD